MDQLNARAPAASAAPGAWIGTRARQLVVLAAAVLLFAAACGGDPDLLAVENRSGAELVVQIVQVPDDRPLETGPSRSAAVPVDVMYETELVEITGETSARIQAIGPGGAILCEHVATESEPAPRLIVLEDGCSIAAGGSQ